MTRNSNMMQEIEPICPNSIGLLNDTLTFTSKEGSVALGERIKLSKVLYVPSPKCNLISIAKLCKELGCSVTFFDNFCVLQGCTLRTPISVVEQKGGVYYFKGGSLEKNDVNAVNMVNLWHKQLGHPSHEVLSLLPSSLGVINYKNKNDMCETCPIAKQIRIHFPISSKKAICVFNLIHCDICGSYKEASSCEARYFLTAMDKVSRATRVF